MSTLLNDLFDFTTTHLGSAIACPAHPDRPENSLREAGGDLTGEGYSTRVRQLATGS